MINISHYIYKSYARWHILDCPGNEAFLVSDEVIDSVDMIFVFGDPNLCTYKIPANKQVTYINTQIETDYYSTASHIHSMLYDASPKILRELARYKYISDPFIYKIKYICEFNILQSIIDDIITLVHKNSKLLIH